MSSSHNSKIYRIGDYVYVETAPVYPYQIRRIEELTKLGNGQIEAKVQCFYRRRDLSTPLISQADRHAGSAEEDAEIDMGDQELDDTKMHQLSHRELFLSRQYETINASQIRGKCLVALYCETEVLPKYSEKEDWFYYCLVYDPQQKALLADKGETGVGTQYQPVVPPKLEDTSKDNRDLAQLETMVWTTQHKLTDREVDQFLVVSRSVGTFARALDCSSSVKQPSLHMSAAAASRDITQFHALRVLHKSNYDVSKAVACLVPTGGPVLCRDEMEEWSAGEAGLFEEAITKYGKDFSDIQKDFLPWKSISSIIEYYYMWKTTDRYVRQKRLKTVEKESDLKQILVSNPPGTTCITGSGDKESVNSIPYPPPGVLTKPPTPSYSCESCYANTSTHWFPWTTANNQYKHYVCSVCWVYWKKYGGLKKPDGFSSRRGGEEDRYTCRLCGKVFNRAERLSNHMVTHKPFKCFVSGCDKTYNTKANLTRHLSSYHSMRPPSPTRAKPKDPFFMKVLPLTKLSRYLCSDILKFPHLARVFNVALNSNDIRQACVKKVSATNVQDFLKRKRVKERKPLEKVVEVLKTSPPKVTRDVSIASPAPSHVTKTRSKTSSSMHPSPITSPTRKLLHSSRLYIAPGNGNDVTETRSSQGKHLLSRKRSIDSSSIQQNGIDAPATKRFISSSPLGKKGCECTQCGKVLHNQASLSHHMQSVHAVSPLAVDAVPKQKSYPAYCDVNPGMGPGITKMAPYAEHTVTSYNTNTALANPVKTHVNVPKPRPAILTKPVVPLIPKTQPPVSQPQTSSVNRKTNSAPAKNHSSVNGTSQNKSRGRLSPTRQPQFIDPPEEFVFSSNKIIKTSRKKLTESVKRRLPRKPWMEVKCSPELKEIVFPSRKTKKGKEKAVDLTVLPNSDAVLVDGKLGQPVKSGAVKPEVPGTTDSTQGDDVPEKSTQPQGSSGAVVNAGHPGKSSGLGNSIGLENSDSLGVNSDPEKSGGSEIPGVPVKVEGKLVTPLIAQVTLLGQMTAGALGKPSESGNSGVGVAVAANVVEPIVIDD